MKMNMNTANSKREYSCRDEELPLSFGASDQLLACEAVTESTPIREIKNEQLKENVNDSGNVMNNDGCKQTVCFELTDSKQKVIVELKQFNYRTSPIKIATLLTKLFYEWPSFPGHWLYIAQKYNPRAICRTIDQLIKVQKNGQKTIENPSAFFTFLIKKRKQRKD